MANFVIALTLDNGRTLSYGLSTDTKLLTVSAGSTAIETDTDNEFLYNGDRTAAGWIQKSTAGAGNVFASAKSSGLVTKSDSTVLDYNALYIGGAGDVSIDHTEGGAAVVYVGLLAGSILPVQGVRVNAATTATNIVWMKW